MPISPFAPQLFLLLGIDIFLGASILTVMLDDNFRDAVPYILDAGAMFGFAQLLIGPGYLSGFSSDVQFWYCVGYATVAFSSVLAINLYLFFIKKRRFLSGFFAIGVCAPSFLVELFFISSYVNGISPALPLLPVMPWSTVYVAFFATTIIMIVMMILSSSSKILWGSTTSGSSITHHTFRMKFVSASLVRAYRRVRRFLSSVKQTPNVSG